MESFALPAPWPNSSGLRIAGVRAIVTAPEGHPLVVVRVDTSDSGLYGLGCATFTQRFSAVVDVVDNYLAPLLAGRDPADIDDLGALIRFSSYWREGPVLNSALSGVDQALWDIAGKRAGMPVHELAGGRQRAAVPVYEHAAGRTPDEVAERVGELVADGATAVRIQASSVGLGHYGAPGLPATRTTDPFPQGWDVEEYLAGVPPLFAAVREAVGPTVRLLHDAHSRLTPRQALGLAHAIAEYQPYFLEDPIPPELYDRLPEVRAASPVPIAVGELLTSSTEAARLVSTQAVDFLRLHVSAVGGFSTARRLSTLCEFAGVSTAWHGPADVSPIGVAANTALSLTTSAFGIQEAHRFPDAALEVFPGALLVQAGHLRANQAPGWGIDLDEHKAAAFPPGRHRHDRWASTVRRPDGSLSAP